MKKCIEYFEIHDYDPPVNRKIISSDLSKNFSAKNYHFFNGFNPKTIKPLLDAASYLDIKILHNTCICFLATKFYI